MTKTGHGFAIIGFTLTFSTSVIAQEVGITSDMMSLEYSFSGETYTIQRNQNLDASIAEFYTKTSRACPPFCIQPITIHEGVETVGELELLSFLTEYVDTGKGFLIDTRTPESYNRGTIPGAANLPHQLFIPDESNVFFDAIMVMLHGKSDGFGEWVFNDPPDLLLFCNGPWCGQSPAAIRNLLAIDYPVEKLHYYRGGMQNWESMGFSVQLP